MAVARSQLSAIVIMKGFSDFDDRILHIYLALVCRARLYGNVLCLLALSNQADTTRAF
jgi:hypothetical protein